MTGGSRSSASNGLQHPGKSSSPRCPLDSCISSLRALTSSTGSRTTLPVPGTLDPPSLVTMQMAQPHLKTGVCHIGQAGLELLTLSDLPTSAFQNAGISGVCHHTRP
ncbi:Protein GVQW1, partial [Plecturocebus cupreus]